MILQTSSNVETKTHYAGLHKEITFSSEDQSAIFYKKNGLILGENQSFTLFNTKNGWVVDPESSQLYLNGQKLTSRAGLEMGDLLFFPFMAIPFLEEDLLQISSLEGYETKLPFTVQPTSEMSKKYPVYRRTPRMVYEMPKDKVTLTFPTQEHEDSNRGLWLIIMPPSIMLIVMGVVALIQPRGIFIIISMVMFMTTLVTSTVHYFRDKGDKKRRKERRHRVYTTYLENKRKELQELSDKQKKDVLYFHFPSFERMKYLTSQLSDRIWERSLESIDVLQFRLGTGNVPASYEVSVSSKVIWQIVI